MINAISGHTLENALQNSCFGHLYATKRAPKRRFQQKLVSRETVSYRVAFHGFTASKQPRYAASAEHFRLLILKSVLSGAAAVRQVCSLLHPTCKPVPRHHQPPACREQSSPDERIQLNLDAKRDGVCSVSIRVRN